MSALPEKLPTLNEELASEYRFQRARLADVLGEVGIEVVGSDDIFSIETGRSLKIDDDLAANLEDFIETTSTSALYNQVIKHIETAPESDDGTEFVHPTKLKARLKSAGKVSTFETRGGMVVVPEDSSAFMVVDCDRLVETSLVLERMGLGTFAPRVMKTIRGGWLELRVKA